MGVTRNLSSLAFSIVVHLAVLALLALVQVTIALGDPAAVIETIMSSEDRQLEEFQKKLDDSKTIAETMSFESGGLQSTQVGGSDAPLAQQTKVEIDNVVKEADVEIRIADTSLPGLDQLGEDLGEAEVTGEVGALVEGYGAALDRLTQELLRLMRTDRVLAIWLFAESGSMKDDQEELKGRIHRVYEELKIVQDDADKLNGRRRRKSSRNDDILLTAIASFGAGTMPENLTALAAETARAGCVVVVSSRVSRVTVLPETMTSIQGEEVVPSGILNPQKSALLVSLALDAGHDRVEVQLLEERPQVRRFELQALALLGQCRLDLGERCRRAGGEDQRCNPQAHACRSCRLEVTSATIETAISAGDLAPIASPTGQPKRSRGRLRRDCLNRQRRAAHGRCEPG